MSRQPALASLAPRCRAWEAARYRAYQEQLAACTIGQTFVRAAEFLELAAAGALSITVGDARAGR